MRDYLHLLRATGGLRESRLVSTAVLTLTAIAFFRIALLPEFGRDLSMSTFQLGLLTTTFGIGRLVADLPGGHLADRIQARSLMAVSAGGVALGSLILGLSVVALGVYVAAFVVGISSATTNATGMTFFSNVGGASHRRHLHGRVLRCFAWRSGSGSRSGRAPLVGRRMAPHHVRRDRGGLGDGHRAPHDSVEAAVADRCLSRSGFST